MTIQPTKPAAPALAAIPPPAPAPKRAGGLRDAKRYRVLQPEGRPVPFFIEVLEDDAQLAAILKGDKIPRADRKMTTVYAGETSDNIPAASSKWMAASGWICEANGPDDPYAKPVKGAAE